MKNPICLLLAVIATLGLYAQDRTRPLPQKPNVILIMTDDQGLGDAGFMGNPFIRTPVLDKLAAGGKLFENFYTAPVCTPSRASLLTGRYSLRTGVFDTYNGGAVMAAEELTMAEIFQLNGYRTGLFGKWHLGDHHPFRPSDQGFDESLMHPGGGIGQPGDPDNYFRFDSSYFSPVLLKNGKKVQTTGYCSDVFTDGLLEFIRTHRGSPFFAFLSFNAPHDPLQLPAAYYRMYDHLGRDFENSRDERFSGGKLSPAEVDAAARVYGMMTNIDDNIGRVMAMLKTHQLQDRTMVIFLSDNGPAQHRFRAGLRGTKTSVYEGGIRVPAFLHGPGVRPERVRATLSHMDLLPTLIDYLKLETPAGAPERDGRSFAALLRGEAVPPVFATRSLYYHWQRGFPEADRNVALRKGNFKLVGRGGRLGYNEVADAEAFELFNIAADPGEKNNLAGQYPQRVDSMRREFEAWWADALQSDHLAVQKFRIGTGEQQVTELTRNDARGLPTMWVDDTQYGFWDVSVATPGIYRIRIRFREPLPGKGRVIVRLAPFQKTLDIREAGVLEAEISGLFLKEGDYRLESGFSPLKGPWLYPFTVSIEKAETR